MVKLKFSARRRTGNTGEEIAAQYLESKCFRIIDRNYLKPWGEIDIIAEKSGIIRFIEVKSISREINSGISREMDNRPEELVTRDKLRKLARTAALYMEQTKDAREYQIDVVGVIMDKKRKLARCRLFEQALDDNL